MWVSSELLDAQFMYCEMAETRSTYKPSTSIHWHVQWNWIVRTSIHWKYNIVQNGTIFRNFYSCILTIISTCTRTSYTLLAYRSAKTLPAQAQQDPEAQENCAEALASSYIFFTSKSTTPPLSSTKSVPNQSFEEAATLPSGGSAQRGATPNRGTMRADVDGGQKEEVDDSLEVDGGQQPSGDRARRPGRRRAILVNCF